jgi:hypothetical protein
VYLLRPNQTEFWWDMNDLEVKLLQAQSRGKEGVSEPSVSSVELIKTLEAAGELRAIAKMMKATRRKYNGAVRFD